MKGLHPEVLEQKTKKGGKRFSATNRWLLGYRSGRRVVLGWATRFGWALRIPTKKKSFDMDEMITKVKRFQWWCVNLMTKPADGEVARDNRYGKYPGTAGSIWIRCLLDLLGYFSAPLRRKVQK